jgi:serine protease AprX
VTVVFAAGNSGSEVVEMSQNPFSEAPWVISVAAGALDHHRGYFSSNGLAFDNSQATQIGGGGHTTWLGDRIGVYHPDVTAPGVAISSTCDTAGTVIGPCPPPNYDNATADGTSMASPHIAGAAAVLLQANPALTSQQIFSALQATATPVKAADGSALPFWQVGYGYVDLNAAVDLVRSGRNWAKNIQKAQATADARVLGADGFAVSRSDMWQYTAPPATFAGTDSQTFTSPVAIGTGYLKVTLSHPSLAVVGINGTSYTVTVKDAAGRVLGTTTESLTAGAGTAGVLINLATSGPVAYGNFTYEVSGFYAASDPDTLDSDSLLGRVVALQVAQVNRY